MRQPATGLSLRLKLVLSYLGVALGAILLLIVVISIAVQSYFYAVERDQLLSRAVYLAQQVGEIYYQAGENWSNVPPISDRNPELFEVYDTNQQSHSGRPPEFVKLSQSDVPTLHSAMLQALNGKQVSGSLQGSSTDSSVFSGLYVSVPIYDNGQAGGKLIGALVLAQPDKYPQGFAPGDVLAALDKVILITGAMIAIIVIAFSVFLTRRLTRPLVLLTAAAEQVKSGDYSQRVEMPPNKDEIGTLAQTFNDMADKIETDVTELRRQDQLRRDMIANIAHDLITPLTAIQGFSEAIADEVISDPEARYETAQLIGREVQRLRRLVSDMQNMTALETGRMQLDIAPLNMHALVKEVLEVIGPECEQAEIALRNEIAPNIPLVMADSDRITQVLLNLLDNARRHTLAGGSISVGTSMEADAKGAKWLAVSVQDSGIGIDPADLPFIFDRFFRIDRARSGANGASSGSGLGLSIVKAIITGHGGTIKADSTPGQGTTITFKLPVADTARLQPTQSATGGTR
ncbi:MAG TPA: HAMP domain-containing sensor histidine kinase [Ktedonobacteraceae bacterium]|nr:HAMP domain-containing sensor histidine kinase [Ktedonobacteraceae bacterium]